MSRQMDELSTELLQLRKDWKSSRVQLEATETVLQAFKTKALHLEKHHDISRSKVQKLQGRYTHLEEENSALQMENFELVSELEDKQHEIECQQKDHDTTSTQLPKFLSSKIGNRYSPEIRMLYYSLLENEVPAVKIETVIKSVIKCFHPSVSIEFAQKILCKLHAP